MRDFDSINAFFSDREIEVLQAAIDTRREARLGGPGPRRGIRRWLRAAPQLPHLAVHLVERPPDDLLEPRPAVVG